MAERALYAYRLQLLAIFGKESGQTDHSISLEEHKSARWIGEIDFSLIERVGYVLGNGVDIDLETELESLLGVEPMPFTAQLLASNCLMKLELAAPEILATEGVETKDLLALL